jgi:UDP:flavonoid glycosyltransferase YjiC (YdhE family)
MLKILVSTIFQDSGEATRAIEICKELEKLFTDEEDFHIIFLSRNSRFDNQIIQNGWELEYSDPRMSGVGLHQDLKMKKGELIGEYKIAYEVINGEYTSYQKIRPDIVLFGFWPVAGLVRRLFSPEIPGICFIPLPISNEFINNTKIFPDDVPLLSRLPIAIQSSILKSLPSRIKQRNPLLSHSVIRKAIKKYSNNMLHPKNIVDMLSTDLMLVNDISDYYEYRLPERIHFTGPVFAQSIARNDNVIELNQYLRDNRVKIFATLGSSGNEKQLIEVIQAAKLLDQEKYVSLILCPSSIADIDKMKVFISGCNNIYITDKFINSNEVLAKTDIAVCHGGQGTLQTVISNGVPFVGIATQPEQQVNLDHMVSNGAGIRIHKKQWERDTIKDAIERISNSESFKDKAKWLRSIYLQYDGKKESAKYIYEYLIKIGGRDLSAPPSRRSTCNH